MEYNLPYLSSSVMKYASFLPPGDMGTLLLGMILAVAAIVLVFILKRVLENLVIGVIGFLLLKFVLGVNIPLIPGLIISLVFGLGGLAVLLILHFFGVL